MTEREGSRRTGPARRYWQWWKRVGKKIGDLQARGLLGIFYYVIFALFALPVRWFCDPLAIKDDSPRGWRLRGEDEDAPEERATRQF